MVIKELGKNRNRSPGSDGLPIEFYIVFWSRIKHLFYNMLQMNKNKGELTTTQKEGLISLIQKKDKDVAFLKNWRPISLLNTDYKIIAKIISNKIKFYISDLINSDQTGFLKGRFIGENINKAIHFIEYCEKHNIEGMIVNIDFEKAFDSIEWSYIQKH